MDLRTREPAPEPPPAVDRALVTVRPSHELVGLQRLPYFVGISGETAGTQGLSLHMVVIPPGACAVPHRHVGYETAIYILKGRIETRYGLALEHSSVNVAGDFLFIPPDVPHQPFNLSDTEEARAIVARNDPDEQESTLAYEPPAA